MPTGKSWYTRQHGVVGGPYPGDLIDRFIVLGRLHADTEVSLDGVSWQPLGQAWDLSSLPDGEALHRAQLWEDQRVTDRRTTSLGSAEERRSRSDRRRSETPGAILRRIGRARRMRQGPVLKAGPLVYLGLGGLLALLTTASVYLYFVRVSGNPIDTAWGRSCALPLQPGVRWTHCDLRGRRFPQAQLPGVQASNVNLQGSLLSGSNLRNADFSYANLQGARLDGADLSRAMLKGANLEGAVLSGATLDGADLSYANLLGAEMANLSLRGAVLNHAIWSDGSPCAANAVGSCR